MTEQWTTELDADPLAWVTALAACETAAEFAAALCGHALDHLRAHGAQLHLAFEEPWSVLGTVGRGLALSDGGLARRVLEAGRWGIDGMLAALPLGRAVLEVVGAREDELAALAGQGPLLGLALEGVLAREARRGRGRTAEVVEHLVRRLGGSLDLGEVLTATAESAARAIGFERAFVGLFREFGPTGAQTGEVYTYGFDGGFQSGVDVRQQSFERLMQRGEPILFERARDEGSQLASGLSELNPESALIAPLAARGRPLGILYVDTRQAGARVTDDEVWLALAIAEQASLAIDNARLYAEESRKRRAAEALREVGQTLGSSLHLADTLEQVLAHAGRLLSADACAVYELLPDGRSLAIRSAVGLSSEYVLRARAKIGVGVVGRAVARGETVTVRDMGAERVEVGSRYTRQLLATGQYPFRGMVGLPLSARGKTFGGLSLYFSGPLRLDADDLAVAEVLAAQASLAIENARLYEEEVRREREAAVLVNLSKVLGRGRASGAREDDALARATELAVLALNAERGLILLVEGGELQAHPDDAEPTELAAFRLAPSPEEALALAHQLGRGPRRLTRRLALPGAGSALLLPLCSGDQTFGLLYADHHREEAASDRSLQLARAIGDQLSLTLWQERLMDALAREEARYRLLAEGAHDLIIACDAAGTVTYANPAGVRLLGPLEGRPLHELVSPDWKTLFARVWHDTLAAPERSAVCEVEVQGLAGGARLELRLSAVVRDREVLSVLAVARDLSEQQRLAEEINRRGQALEAASARQLELRTYLSLFTQAQEEERRRISRELHDDTAQVLVAITRRIDRLAKELGGEQRARADDIRADLGGAIESVRRFARNLRPSVLDDLGLLPALEWLAQQAATPTRLELQGQDRRLAPDTELTVFRVVQEALTNVDKHAGALSAAVRVHYLPDQLAVTVSDDGRGFDTGGASGLAALGHLGLLGLRERVTLLGGGVEVESAPGEGTALRFSFPG